MKNFFEYDFAEFQQFLAENNFEKFRARQVFDAVYKAKLFEPALFPSIGEPLKKFLAENIEFVAARRVGLKNSSDATGKYLFELSDGNFVESVLLQAPSDDGKLRRTLCMSTQVGCASGCRFCASALRGFVRNLSLGEILAQALPFVEERELDGRKRRVFLFENIVVMGMGEPLANFENLIKALGILNDPSKFAFGARRITVSTCGLADKIRELARMKFPFRLAISLHGATDEVRSQIMPINKKFPLGEVLSAAMEFSKACGRMITLEYILIKGLNDTFDQARKLAQIAKTLHAHVNLIPYNRVEGLEWKRPDPSRRRAFADILERAGVSCTLRREKGSQIEAACGQLALKKKLGDSLS